MNETTGQLQYRVIEKLQFFQQRPKEIFSLLRCFFKCGKETLASHILCKDKEIGIVDIFYRNSESVNAIQPAGDFIRVPEYPQVPCIVIIAQYDQPHLGTVIEDRLQQLEVHRNTGQAIHSAETIDQRSAMRGHNLRQRQLIALRVSQHRRGGGKRQNPSEESS